MPPNIIQNTQLHGIVMFFYDLFAAKVRSGNSEQLGPRPSDTLYRLPKELLHHILHCGQDIEPASKLMTSPFAPLLEALRRMRR